MESFEVNKLIGALLGTVFVLFSITLVAGALFDTHAPETPGYAIEAAEPGEGGAAPAEEAVVPIATLLQDADADSGQSIFRKCQACHTGEQGGANKVGPNLWNIVNRPIASHEGFSYSAAMKEFAGTAGEWTYEHLNTFLTKPKALVKGTAMGFIGLPKPEDRADVIAYLRTLSDSPAPLPEAPAAEEESAQAPAEGGAATEGETAAKPAEGEVSADKPAASDETKQAPSEGDAAAKPADQQEAGEKSAETAPADEPAEDSAEKPAD